MATSKSCYTCAESKPIAAFASDKGKKDGLSIYCRACVSAKWATYAPAKTEAFRAAKKAYDAKRHATFPEIARAHNARAQAAHPGRAAKNAKAWAKANPEKRRLIAMSYKSRRRAAEGKGIGGRELAHWVESQVKVCFWCDGNCADGFHVDHFQPLSKGGQHETGNLVIACPGCNLKKSAKDPEVFAQQVWGCGSVNEQELAA